MTSQITYHTATAAISDMASRNLKPEAFMECCKVCPNFGKTWSCPPFDYDPQQRMAQYSQITLYVARITTDKCVDYALDDVFRLFQPARAEMQRQVLQAERDLHGFALFPVGRCLQCDNGCSRADGKPCRHPELVRPAPESWGWDVGGLTRDMLGLEIEWANGSKMPQTLTLVAAVLHN